jgi:predicted ATPase
VSRIAPLLCPLLVGRDDLLDLVDRRIGDAAAGRGHLLLLAGEAGIGKTRLLGALSRKAEAAGLDSAVGALAPQDRHVPGSLVLDMARTMLRIPRFANLGRDLLAMPLGEEGSQPQTRRLVVVGMVDRIVEDLESPAMIAFEDLQWADDLSLEVVAELARRTHDRATLLVGAYRTDELLPGSILREWRARLLTQRLAEEARLAPLTLDQTALMTTLIIANGLPAPREVVAAVYERTDGIPLHIEELLGALGDDTRADGRAIREANVPATIEDAVLARFERLSPEGRAVAQAGAVIGRCFVQDVLAGIMDTSPAELDEPLRELIDQAFLDPPGRRGLYDYRHQLLRDALYRTVPPSELRRLHARVGEFGGELEGASEIHASVHFERAGLRAQAFRAALSGARTAAKLSSHREAFELYRRAVENMPADLDAAEQGALYEAYGVEAAAIELHDVAERAALTGRERFFEAGRPVDAARQLTTLAGIARREAHPLEVRSEPITRGLAELETQPATPERELARHVLLVEGASLLWDS